MPNNFCVMLLLLLLLLLGSIHLYAKETILEQRERIKKIYNLKNASAGSLAVDTAVDHILEQQSQFKTRSEIKSSSSNNNNYNTNNDKTDSLTNKSLPHGLLPRCRATMDAIVNDGFFVYKGDNAIPDYKECWARSTRYHVAPVCEALERKTTRKPIHKWRWSLGKAERKECKLPEPEHMGDVIVAARSYLNDMKESGHVLRDTTSPDAKAKYKDAAGTTVNILMLGLSFMGQPFQALTCMNNQYLDIDESWAISDGTSQHRYVREILGEDFHGACTGYVQDHIKDWYPPDLHQVYEDEEAENLAMYEFNMGVYKHRAKGRSLLNSSSTNAGKKGNINASHKLHNLSIPVQHVNGCNLHNGLMVFKSKSSDSRGGGGEGGKGVKPLTVRICYTYTFAIDRNIKPGSKLPCEWSWNDVDVVFSLHEARELHYYFKNTGAFNEVKTNTKSEDISHNGKPPSGVSYGIQLVKVFSVNTMYEGYLFNKMTEAYQRNNFEPFEASDYQSKPIHCSHADIHYRMPGWPDQAVTIWLSYLATGLVEPENKEKQKECPNSSKERSFKYPEHYCKGNYRIGGIVPFYGRNDCKILANGKNEC